MAAATDVWPEGAPALGLLDLDAYLDRIGLRGRPTVAQVHRAHLTTIPFENLDPHRGVPVSLALADLERKLVSERRGGYCFEQNLLLAAALEALGHEVELMLGRVRVGGVPGALRPRTHLLLRVGGEDAIWLADVGFAQGSPLEPLPFGPGGVHERSGWRYRVVEEGRELVVQVEVAGAWTDLYAFVAEPVPVIDVQTSSWYVSTHPRSPFVSGLIVSADAEDGIRTSLSDWGGELVLTQDAPTGRTVTPVAREAAAELLAERFSLPGFALDDTGAVIRVGDQP